MSKGSGRGTLTNLVILISSLNKLGFEMCHIPLGRCATEKARLASNIGIQQLLEKHKKFARNLNEKEMVLTLLAFGFFVEII